ncbi:MAG: hypothetical protein AAF585_27010, partial [Verrucomicrobiota bacterium]
SANDTAMHPGDSGPEPVGWFSGEESIVQMVKEHIEVKFGKKHADVVVKFTFRSHKKEGNAKQLLGFPDEFHTPGRDWDVSGPLKNMKTLVNGKKVKSKVQSGLLFIDFDRGKRAVTLSKESENSEAGPAAWHVIEVDFPPGEDVTVERHYRANLGATAGGPNFFAYTTFTGGNWRGKIEKMTADIHLVDGLTADDVAIRGYTDGLGSPKLAGTTGDAKRLTDKHLQIVWENFEPRDDPSKHGFSIDWWDPKLVKLLESGGE